jgi:hypothetical protein
MIGAARHDATKQAKEKEVSSMHRCMYPILPTVPVHRTIRGIIEGRDEDLEKALEIINHQ